MFNRTVEFRQCVEERRKTLPDGTRRKLSRPPRRPLTDYDNEQNALLSSREFVTEAYTIVSRVETPHSYSMKA